MSSACQYERQKCDAELLHEDLSLRGEGRRRTQLFDRTGASPVCASMRQPMNCVYPVERAEAA
jgi:hypothetical protein